MRKMHENYLLLTKLKEFDNGIIKYFVDRLSIFLCIDLNEYPDIMFTRSIKKIKNQYDIGVDDKIEKFPRAFYDDDQNIVVFNALKYDLKSEYFYTNSEEISEDIEEKYIKQYRYIVPISDIYHELTHFFQCYLMGDKYDDVRYTDIIEASDEIYTYFLTGQMIDYERQSVALWYLSKYYLKLRGMKFYMFIRDIIVNPNWEQNYILNNKEMIKMLADDYDGNIINLINRIKIDFYRKDLIEEFYKDIDEIHKLIFYKW
jgi:hypothetical protein